MLKLKYLEENFELARYALNYWHHDGETLTDRLKWFRISSNGVYPFDRDGRLCFLRLSPAEEKERLELEGELDFLEYLRRCGYPAGYPIPAENGERLLLLDTPWGKWYASAFQRVAGVPLEDVPMTEELAEAYGAALGRLHCLSMGYCSPVRRRTHQDALEWIREILKAHSMPDQILTAWDDTSRELARLPRTPAGYGLIHYDFELDNVFWDGQKCSAIDFEDGMMHFYALDVVVALDELEEDWQGAFLRGYRGACPDAAVEERDFSLMRRFRDLYSCARLLHSLSEKPVPEPEWMPGLTARLESRLRELISRISA